MADPITLPGTGEIIATEEITTLNGTAVTARKIERVGLALITADGAAHDVDDATPVPTEDAAAAAALASILAKLLAAPATEAKQDTGNASLTSIITLLTTQASYLDGVETLLGRLPSGGAASEATLASLLTLAGFQARVPVPKTVDYDSGAGTDTVQMLGLALPASGGAVSAPGDTANGLDVDVTRLPALPAGSNAIGTVGTTPFTTVKSGELQGSTSALQLPNVACSMVRFKAAIANSGYVYLGASGVTKVDGTTDTSTGMQLTPGDDTGWIPCDNLNRFYRICDNTTDALTYLAMV